MNRTELISHFFLEEILKSCFHHQDVLDIVSENELYQYIPKELSEYKAILKAILDYSKKYGKIPTIGIVSQTNQQTEKIDDVLKKIDGIKLPDKDNVLFQLNKYLKRAMFQKLFYDLLEMFNSGKQDEAIEHQFEQSKKIFEFSIFNKENKFEDIFNSFDMRQEERAETAMNNENPERKIPFGIDALDTATHGGIDASIGETGIFLGRSGTGKSTFLRHIGISAARRGFKVLHFQAEGTREECLNSYDSGWTGIGERSLIRDDIEIDLREALQKIVKDIKNKNGGIAVKAFEQFNTATFVDIRNEILNYHSENGCYPDLILLDYLELISPDGTKYGNSFEGEKLRREHGAKRFKNICTEFKIAGMTASQVTDIEPANFNNESWFMTRHNTPMAKGLIDSFSFFFTWNQSRNEYIGENGRIYVDKMRRYKSEQLIQIATNFKLSRFYDKQKTLDQFGLDCTIVKDDPKDFKRGRKKKGENTLNKEKDE